CLTQHPPTERHAVPVAPPPPPSVRGNPPRPHRIGPIRLRDQFLAQACKPLLQTRCFDRREGYSVHSRRSRIGAGQRIGMAQDVFPVNLVVEQVEAEGRLRLRLTVQLSLKGPDRDRCCQAHRQSPSPHHLRKRTRSQGPLLNWHCPASTLVRPCPTSALAAACRDVEAATLTVTGLPRLPKPPFRRAVPTTPADRAGADVDCFSAHTAFPKWQEGRHPHCHFRDAMGRTVARCHHRRLNPLAGEHPMSQPNDLSRSLTSLEQDSTIIAVIEMSQSSWLVAGIVPGIERHPLKKIEPSEEELICLLMRWRAEATKHGRTITCIAVAFEAGRDGFWLARWLRARDIEIYVIHPTSVAVSREHRRAKT